MSRTNSAVTFCAIAVLHLAVSNPVSATTLGFTDILENANETSTTEFIADRYGNSGRRVHDDPYDSSVKNTDVEWNLLSEAGTPTFKEIDSNAGYTSVFGIIFENSFYSLDAFLASFKKDVKRKFNLGIRTTATNGDQYLWSSDKNQNSDGRDHMVTWIIDEVTGTHAVAFEDLPGGGDGDFNDRIYEVTGFVDGPIPEPATLALMGLGLAGIGYKRYRSKTAE